MKAGNDKLFSSDDLASRLKDAMQKRGLDEDDLVEKLKANGYDIKKSNLKLYLVPSNEKSQKRTPNLHLLIALSKALSVSTDYLLGREDYFSDRFDYHTEDRRYAKYRGTYQFYFFPTESNSPKKLENAILSIGKDKSDAVSLHIDTEDIKEKDYRGKIMLSADYDSGYIFLIGQNVGECVFLSFIDPRINGESPEIILLLGGMISTSAGLKRVPVMSRFLLSRDDLTEKQLKHVKANLWLNSKYINITDKNLQSTLSSADYLEGKNSQVLERIENAFMPKRVYSLEESYIMNTLKSDFSLSPHQVSDLIDDLRNASIKDANQKINRTLDSRMFYYLHNED